MAALLNRGAELDAKLPGGRTPLHEAAATNENPDVLTALLAAGADVNARGASDEPWEPSGSYASRADWGATPWGGKILLSEYAGVRTPLHEAVMANGGAAKVAALVAGGADVNAIGHLDHAVGPGATPLFWAVYGHPDPAVPELLVRAGADIDARAASGWTPLHMAATLNPVLFPILLELGADSEAVDRYGKTPMDYAAVNLWLEGWDPF